MRFISIRERKPERETLAAEPGYPHLKSKIWAENRVIHNFIHIIHIFGGGNVKNTRFVNCDKFAFFEEKTSIGA